MLLGIAERLQEFPAVKAGIPYYLPHYSPAQILSAVVRHANADPAFTMPQRYMASGLPDYVKPQVLQRAYYGAGPQCRHSAHNR